MATEHWFKSRIHELSEPDCKAALSEHQVGRIVFNDQQGPVALPVNYSMDGDDILVTTTPYGSIARGAADTMVAFEIDDLDEFSESGWSVVVRGWASLVGLQDQPEDEDNRPYPWAEGKRNLLIRLRPQQITGIRLFPV